MKARDIMTTEVVATTPEASARSIARLLANSGISAVPVVDEQGVPIGMVSEGDLMPRDESERDARRDWWLRMLEEGEELNPEFTRYLESQDRSARDMMISPVITVDENADIVEIAELLSTKRIKRVPVMRNGRMAGIVSRADLVRAFANKGQMPDVEPSLDRSAAPVAPTHATETAKSRRLSVAPLPATSRDDDGLSASVFRNFVLHFEEEQAARRDEARAQVTEAHHQQARQMLAEPLSEQSWQHMLHGARVAAQNGDEEQLLLRFPCELCTDHGRAVNAPDPLWPETLRGIAAEVFMRWKNELKPHGFGLLARVVDFPDGVPGDIGLFLSWGRKE